MKKIVIVGDSIAAGLFDGETTDLLDNYILEMLQDVGFPDYQVVNLGERGASTESALAGIDEAVAQAPDFVVINVGINDAINLPDSLQAYGENLKEMVSKFAPEKVILVGPSFVDQSKKTQADQETIKEYVAMAKNVAEETGVDFIDFYHHMVIYPAATEFLQADGLHPSKFGYHLLGSLIARDIKNKLLG